MKYDYVAQQMVRECIAFIRTTYSKGGYFNHFTIKRQNNETEKIG